MTMETKDDGAFSHDEADITIISYIHAAANDGKNAIRVLSDDTDVFVLLVYWTYRTKLDCKVKMECVFSTLYQTRETIVLRP